MSSWRWSLQRCDDPRFPYRISIDKDGQPWLRLKAQDGWPGAGKQVFCLRDEGPGPTAAEVIEQVEVLAVNRRGVRLSVVLDRPAKRRCDFVFVNRTYKTKPEEQYEQIFWQTQQSLVQRRPKARPPALASKSAFEVVIAVEERYPWRFPGATTRRARLASGDYALLDGGQTLATVERKSFENLLADFGVLPLLHQRLLDLSAQANSALVVEAPYEDFITPGKLHHYSPSYCSAVLADLYATLPGLRIVFCSNRKTANAWAHAFFAAVWAVRDQPVGSIPALRKPRRTERQAGAGKVENSP